MKHLERLVTVALPVALIVLAGPSTASATIEVGGVAKNEPVAVKASLIGSLLLKDTSGSFANTCTGSSVEGSTEAPFNGTTVSGKISGLTFGNCTNEPVVVDARGTFSVEHITGTTNGTLRSNGAKVTVPSPFGALSCMTSNTDIGTLTGQASGSSVVDINAVLNCGFFLPSAKWEGIYPVTSPEGLGVTSAQLFTSLEVGGVAKGESIAIKASLSGSELLQATGGGFANTCSESSVEGSTEAPFNGTTVGGKLSNLTFGKCTNEAVVVEAAGTLSVANIAGTTNGTVRSSGAKVRVPSPFGTLTCTTNETDLGTLTGVSSGKAMMDINAVLDCGFFLPSARWEGIYSVTSPEGLGVTS